MMCYMNIIIIEPSLDDGLIFTISNYFLSKLSEGIGNNIHDRMHPESCWTSDTYGEMWIESHKYEKIIKKEYRKKMMKSKTKKSPDHRSGGECHNYCHIA